MTYRAPVEDILFAMTHAGGMAHGIADGVYGDLADGVAEAVLEEAGKFASERLAPLNRIGDQHGTPFKDGKVTMPPGWTETYRDWAAAGWGSLVADAEFGGQGLPTLLNSACTEMWNAANMAFSLNPLLTMGAIEALNAHGSDELKATYLPKMISGEWTGTMNLTEPGAGSDLSVLRTKAERAGDGTYRITGQKIFITYGEHDMTPNIIHLVLARLPDAPAGTRGISLFLVPKFLLNDDGTLGKRNDARCHSIEHKLGIHSSPTCTMVFGDEGGAVGYLIGEENRGLNHMFTMMNNARLGVALQGVAIAERAYQHALAYAGERKQGRAVGETSTGSSAIIHHPDVKRMLLDMRTKTAAARAICYATAGALDRAERLSDPASRKAAHEMAGLLTPVAKAFGTDIGIEVASTGVQVHGGMGFVEETGAAQYLRDARIAAIYEGTNGIQAIDLVMRKLPLSGGETVAAAIKSYKDSAEKARMINDPGFDRVGRILGEAVNSLGRCTEYMLKAIAAAPNDALAGATPYLRLFGVAAGGAYLVEQALASRVAQASGETDPAYMRRIADARYFVETHSAGWGGLETTIVDGADAVNEAYSGQI
ncbi:MAG: acyl-CoA dehydrogenase [Proteobacteria bacterium]|nr:acyl-CoA dehydrogenase [Pseudomonadota bacterium]